MWRWLYRFGLLFGAMGLGVGLYLTRYLDGALWQAFCVICLLNILAFMVMVRSS